MFFILKKEIITFILWGRRHTLLWSSEDSLWELTLIYQAASGIDLRSSDLLASILSTGALLITQSSIGFLGNIIKVLSVHRSQVSVTGRVGAARNLVPGFEACLSGEGDRAGKPPCPVLLPAFIFLCVSVGSTVYPQIFILPNLASGVLGLCSENYYSCDFCFLQC